MIEQDAIDAAAGDRDALKRTLLACHGRLEAAIARKMPGVLRGVLDPEDILQDVCVQLFRQVDSFKLQRDKSAVESFYDWAWMIARRHLLGVQRMHQALKRDRRRDTKETPRRSGRSSVGAAVDQTVVKGDSPSGSAARHEAIRAVEKALTKVKKEYREALRLRYLEGLGVEETARRMERTTRSVHMLCYRGLAELNRHMGSASNFLSSR